MEVNLIYHHVGLPNPNSFQQQAASDVPLEEAKQAAQAEQRLESGHEVRQRLRSPEGNQHRKQQAASVPKRQERDQWISTL